MDISPKTSQIGHSAPSPLSPFPEGWYFVGSRKSILEAKLVQKTWMGEKIIAWCDEEGSICVAEATCPHLGAELGPVAGGQVRNGRLVCPFHGFTYDATGQCVATPFAPAPKSARLKVFETREILDLVFAWWGNGGRPSQWNLPDVPVADGDWSGLEFRVITFPSHPQETTENAVDLTHLRYVHGYANVSQVGPVSVDGAYLKSCFDFKRTHSIAGIHAGQYDISAITHVFGLGYSFVEIREHSIGMDARLWVLATPVDGKIIDLVLVGQVRAIRKPRRPIVGLRFVPLGWRAKIMNKIIISSQKRDVLQDVVIWERKQYRPHPRLCRSDDEIATYRHYCQQFYSDTQGYNPDEHA